MVGNRGGRTSSGIGAGGQIKPRLDKPGHITSRPHLQICVIENPYPSAAAIDVAGARFAAIRLNADD
jgi:hypothetical protein